MVQVARATPGRLLRLELKDEAALRWSHTVTLNGGPQTLRVELPALGKAGLLLWVLDGAAPGDSVTLDAITLVATTAITDTPTAAFVWSYGMLLSNWDPATGLVRDKGQMASGTFDAIQATGSLAAATAVAEQLGVIDHPAAVQIVNRISRALLAETPRYHGIWPHFVQVSPAGAIGIAPGTEWSSVDTVIAAVGLLAAQGALGLDTAPTEAMLRAIDWPDLTASGDMVAHGYASTGERLSSVWDVFGGESWLVALAYAGATGRVTPLAYPVPPTANGSGFIDELAWLFVAPPASADHWGADWATYRPAAAERQIAYFPAAHPGSCVDQLGLFGLSAAEVPLPSAATPGGTYQAFGVGGRFAEANDGAAQLGAPVVVPHYAALAASLRPREATALWSWLIAGRLFTPLTNVESAMFPAGARCEAAMLEWNQLKGSWNLALQTLGWGRYLAERAGHEPALWRGAGASPLLSRGYALLSAGPPAAPRPDSLGRRRGQSPPQLPFAGAEGSRSPAAGSGKQCTLVTNHVL
jgi:hypothetical protein